MCLPLMDYNHIHNSVCLIDNLMKQYFEPVRPRMMVTYHLRAFPIFRRALKCEDDIAVRGYLPFRKREKKGYENNKSQGKELHAVCAYVNN